MNADIFFIGLIGLIFIASGIGYMYTTPIGCIAFGAGLLAWVTLASIFELIEKAIKRPKR